METGSERESADAALAAVISTGPSDLRGDGTDDREAGLDIDELAAAVGASVTLLRSVARAGLLLPHHVDESGVARYSRADVAAARAGLTLIDAGLPLAALLEVAGRTDAAISEVAEMAVDAFIRFVRDPALADGDEAAAADRLVTAYERMLPATEALVAHHLRRRLIRAGLHRLMAPVIGDTPGEP